MKKTLLTTVLSLSATLAMAADKAPSTGAGKATCQAYPAEEVMSQESLTQRLANIGYQVSSIGTQENCYQVAAKAPDGQDVNLMLDMKTGQVVNPES